MLGGVSRAPTIAQAPTIAARHSTATRHHPVRVADKPTYFQPPPTEYLDQLPALLAQVWRGNACAPSMLTLIPVAVDNQAMRRCNLIRILMRWTTAQSEALQQFTTGAADLLLPSRTEHGRDI